MILQCFGQIIGQVGQVQLLLHSVIYLKLSKVSCLLIILANDEAFGVSMLSSYIAVTRQLFPEFELVHLCVKPRHGFREPDLQCYKRAGLIIYQIIQQYH